MTIFIDPNLGDEIRSIVWLVQLSAGQHLAMHTLVSPRDGLFLPPASIVQVIESESVSSLTAKPYDL